MLNDDYPGLIHHSVLKNVYPHQLARRSNNTNLDSKEDHFLPRCKRSLAMDLQGRLLIVANRLPITIKQHEDGSYEFSMSSGGLVSGLNGLSKAIKFKWFGWPGFDVHRNDMDDLRHQLADQFDAVPIFLSRDLSEQHYNGFSSGSSRSTRT